MSIKIFRLSSFLFAFVFVAAAFCFGPRGFAENAIGQNANSSTTTTENSNAGTTKRRRGRRTKPATTPAESTAAPGAEVVAPASALATTQTDLSGTYAGTFDCADAGLTGDNTLTITGNQFTTSDGKAGRITATTTGGYTGVAMQFGELTVGTKDHPGVSPTIVSLRAKKSRDRLTLMTVPGATHVCTFTPATTSRAKSRRMRMQPAPPAPVETPEPAAATAPAAPTAPVAAPVTPVIPGDEAGPMPPAAPKPAARGRRGTAKPKPTPAPPGN